MIRSIKKSYLIRNILKNFFSQAIICQWSVFRSQFYDWKVFSFSQVIIEYISKLFILLRYFLSYLMLRSQNHSEFYEQHQIRNQCSMLQINSMKSKLRNYEIQSKLGSGSYGVIYKALNRSDKSTCVLKQIKLTSLNQKAKKNAVNEATILGKLCHPFIVQYIDSFIEQGSLNIIMEYCNGGDLAQFLKLQSKKPLKEQKIWRLFIQICIGLQHIHQRKILHRDIKSLNIFLHQDSIKIGDLGVAKMLEQRDFAQTMVGTPFYLSPQLCQQKPYNEKSDIWALGCLLYQLCTFNHPFEAANQASLILKIIRGKYNPIPQFYSKDLKQLIDSCLQRDYKRRPTCQMILSKPKIKELLVQFRLDQVKAIERPLVNAILDQKQNSKEKIAKSKEKKDVKKDQAIAKDPIQRGFVDKSNQIAQVQVRSNENKNLNVGALATPINSGKKEEVKRPQVPLPKKQQVMKRPQIPLPKKPESARRQRQKVIQPLIIQQVQAKQGILLSQKELPPPPVVKKQDKIEKKPESKKDFMNQLDKFMQRQTDSNKKPSIYWQINVKNNEPIKVEKQAEKVQKPVLINKYEAPKEIVTKVKMQKVIQPKVYDSSKNIGKSRGIIKSGGFIPDDKDSKKVEQPKQLFGKKLLQPQIIHKPYENEAKQIKVRQHIKNDQFKSERNLKSNAISSSTPINLKEKEKLQPERYFVRRNSQNIPQQFNMPQPLPPRVRKGSQNQLARNVQNLSHRNNVTKQERQQVRNLPNMMKNDSSDSSENEQSVSHNKNNKEGKITTNSKFNFKLKDVDQNQIFQKYQDILKSQKNSSQRMATNEVSNEQGESHQDHGHQGKSEQLQQEVDIGQNGQAEDVNKFSEQFDAEGYLEQEIQQNFSGSQENYSNLYQVNKFNLAQEDKIQDLLQNGETIKCNQQQENMDAQQQEKQENQWDFDCEPQLPMLQETQTPCFEQVNPYLVDQKQEQESNEDKKNYLQIKLQQNLKREDEINQLMQIKINQCKTMVPNGFQQILDFFRVKLNTDQYTEQDEKEIDVFLKKKGLTDQRKFQNIYKIMHFQMQLQNTRKIVEKLCKKLSQLENC